MTKSVSQDIIMALKNKIQASDRELDDDTNGGVSLNGHHYPVEDDVSQMQKPIGPT